MVHVTSKMSTKYFTELAKIFNVRKELICITYIHPFNTDDAEQVKVEIEERDPTSLHDAINVQKDFSKLTIEVKLQPSATDLPIMNWTRSDLYKGSCHRAT